MTVIESDLAIDRKSHTEGNPKKTIASTCIAISTLVEVEMIAPYRLGSVAKKNSARTAEIPNKLLVFAGRETNCEH
jgi:hypothetical protein